MEKIHHLPENWLHLHHVERLVQCSDGLFIWAATVLKLLSHESNPNAVLQAVLSPGSVEGLDTLYATASKSSCNFQRAESWETFKSIMTAILFSCESLNDYVIDQLPGFSQETSCRFLLTRLHCVLDYTPGSPIHVFHASFREYLIDASRSGGGEPWSLATLNPEYCMLDRCFRVMSNQLRLNMRGFTTSDQTDAEYFQDSDPRDLVSLELRYACTYWSSHLLAAKTEDADILTKLREFSYDQFLFWLEVVSLIGIIDEALTACEIARDHTQDCC